MRVFLIGGAESGRLLPIRTPLDETPNRRRVSMTDVAGRVENTSLAAVLTAPFASLAAAAHVAVTDLIEDNGRGVERR